MDNWYISLGFKAEEIREKMTELLGSYSQELLLGHRDSIQFNKTVDPTLFTPSDVDHQYKRLTIEKCERFFQDRLSKELNVAYFKEPKSILNKYGHLIVNQELAYKAETKRWISNYQSDLNNHAGMVIDLIPGESFSMVLFGKTLTFIFTEKNVKNGIILRKIMKFANKPNSLWNQLKYLIWQINDRIIMLEKLS